MSLPRSNAQLREPGFVDPNTTRYPPAQLRPSEVAPPTKVDNVPQQASTQPGDGNEVRFSSPPHAEPHPTETTGKVPFKEQVIGVAKKARGSILGKPDVKEHGDQILRGEVTHLEDPKRLDEI